MLLTSAVAKRRTSQSRYRTVVDLRSSQRFFEKAFHMAHVIQPAVLCIRHNWSHTGCDYS